MLKVRLIPILLLQDGLLVRSQSFREHQVIGNPIHEASRFNEWNVDELIYIDITRGRFYDPRRDDTKVKGLDEPLKILEAVSRTCFMPLTWGGRIRSIDDMRQRFALGADKITLNTAAVDNPGLITTGAHMFGSQAIVVCIDVLRHGDGRAEVFVDGGRRATGIDPQAVAKEAEHRGAGEILLQSIDRDGTGIGYDTDLIRAVTSVVSIPVIACGGVGIYAHYVEGVRAGAAAVAAANIWHFKELSDRGGKRSLRQAGVNIRY